MMYIRSNIGPVAIALSWLIGAIILWFASFDAGRATSTMSFMTGPGFFPRIVLAGIVIVAVIVIVQELRKKRDNVLIAGVCRVLGLIAITGIYAFALRKIGFVPSSVIFVATTPIILGYRKLPVVVPLAIIYALGVWYIFENIFHIILPASPLFSWF